MRMKKDQAKADAQCKALMAKAKKASDVKAATADAVATCKKMEKVMVQMKKVLCTADRDSHA